MPIATTIRAAPKSSGTPISRCIVRFFPCRAGSGEALPLTGDLGGNEATGLAVQRPESHRRQRRRGPSRPPAPR
jgi:hypothetical protein